MKVFQLTVFKLSCLLITAVILLSSIGNISALHLTNQKNEGLLTEVVSAKKKVKSTKSTKKKSSKKTSSKKSTASKKSAQSKKETSKKSTKKSSVASKKTSSSKKSTAKKKTKSVKYIIDTTINVRSQPNTEADILGVFHKNDSVKVKSSSVKGWGKITYRKKTAYIKLHYAHKGIKEIYLTFDDGPSHNTEKVLKILKKYNVKATFFVCGASSAETSHYLNDIGKAYRAGHAIGAHSYSHQWHIYKSTKTFYKDLDKIQAIIKKQTGKKTSLLRFPGGSGNTVSKKYAKGIMKILTRDVRKKGYQYVDWNASCGDASSKKRMKDAIVRLATASHQDQIVLLMHDSASKEETVKALPEIIETYQKRGYQFKVLNQNAFVCHADDIRN